MSNARHSARAWPALVAVAFALSACSQPKSLGEQCLSRYPRPTDTQIGTDTTSIPASEALPLYRPNDSLPQIYSADSSTGWYRNLFYTHFAAFPGGERAVRSFILRFQARIVGRADTADWYAVIITDPGPDTATFRILRHCIGATHGVYVHSVYSRQPPSLLDSVRGVLPNQRLKLSAAAAAS